MNAATVLQTKKILYLQILPYHIGAYVSDKSYGEKAPFPEDYSHDKSHYYLIVQPMLRLMKDEGGTRLRADLSDSPGLVEYLTATSWDDLQIMALPSTKIASDQIIRTQSNTNLQLLLTAMDSHLAVEFSKQGKAAGQRTKAMTELASFGFEHVKAHFDDRVNTDLLDSVRAQFARHAELAVPNYIPVPFPPDTIMALDFLLGKPGTGTAITVDTQLNSTAPKPAYLKLSADQWADFCAYNFIQREKDQWAQLDLEEKQQFREWAQGVYAALASAHKVNGRFDPDDTINAELKIAWDGFFRHAHLVLAEPPKDNADPRKRWTDWILTTVIPASGQVADEFLFGFLRDKNKFGSSSHYYEHSARLQFPRYFLNGKKLGLQMKAALAEPAAAAGAITTYHANFWNEFAKEADPIKKLAEKDPAGAAAKELVLANRIAAAMVFGERLRIPRPPNPFGNWHLIELKPVADDIDDPNWLVTCNQSLLGQTFRLGPLEDHQTDAVIEFNELRLKLKGHTGFTNVFPAAQIGEINVVFAGLVSEARSYRTGSTSTVKMTIEADPDHPGRIYFERQMFNLARIKVDAPVSKVAGTNAVLFSVPSALLDAVEPSLAFDTSVQSEQIRAVNPRLQMFPTASLSNDLSVSPWSEVRWLARVPVLLRKATLGAYSGSDLFEVALSADLNEAELKRYSSAFANLRADSSKRVHADLWKEIADKITNKFEGMGSLEESIILSLLERRVNNNTFAVGCLFQLRGDALARAKAWLAGPAVDLSGPADLAVTLVLDGSLLDQHFNLLAAPADLAATLDTDQLIPRGLFNFKPAIGVDGIMERFSLNVDGPSKTDQALALAATNARFLSNMLASFTKARFFLSPSADVAAKTGRRDFWLSYPAALLPLKENPGARDNLAKYRPTRVKSGRAYWVTQHFTAPPKTAAQHGIGDYAIKPEDRRYLARVGGPTSIWHLGATVENPFGIRLGASIAADFSLGYAAPVSNLAAAGVPTKKAPNAVVTLPFLHFLVSDQDATHKKLVLTLDNKAVKASLDAGPALRVPDDQSVLEAGPKSLRTLYECLCDLRDASVAKLGVRLNFEAWRFDGNTVAANAPVAQLPADHQEFPAIVSGLCKVPLPRGGVYPLTDTELAPWLNALAPTYSGFLATLRTMANPDAANEIKLIVETGSAPELSQTLLYRVGLQLNRPVDALVPCPPTADGFLVIKPGDEDSLAYAKYCAGGPAQRSRVCALSLEASGVLLEDAGGNAAQDARDEYLRLTTEEDSPWRQNNEWVFPSDASAPTNAIPARTLGDIAAKVQVLAELNTAIPKQRAELYYILYGFVPLGAVVSGDVKLDAATTYQFGHYVAEVLGSVLRGDVVRLASLIDIDFKGADPALAAAAIKTGADPLAAYFAANVSQYWTDTVHHPKNSTATQTMALVRAYGAQYRGCITTLLQNDPSMYAKAKGVAVGAFRPGEFPDQLAYLQISKHILKLDSSGKKAIANPDLINTERFPVMQIQSCPAVPDPLAPHGSLEHRYFVDVLEDALYGDFFQIPALGSGAQFGGVLARSAADYLSNSNRFDQAPGQVVGTRALELSVKHEETAWQVDSKAVYVLPARKPPTTPIPVLPLMPGRITSAWRELYGRQSVADASLEAAFRRIFFTTPDAAHAHFPSELKLAAAEGDKFTIYRRVGEEGDFPLSTSASKPMPPGWHHVDTSCAHFYFLVNSSEENTIDLDQFNLELIRRPLRESVVENRLGAVAAAPELTELIKWHTYYLAKERNAESTEQVPPEKMPHGLLNPALGAAIDLLWPVMPAAVATAPEPIERIAVALKRNSYGWSLSETITTDASWSSGLGGLVGVDVLAAGNSRQFLLHFTVLHQPWSTLEATLGVQRNLLDLDQKNGPDINERFVMASDLSDLVWLDPSSLSIDFYQEKMFDSALRTLTHELDVSAWLDANKTAPDAPFSFAAAFAKNFYELSLKKFNSSFPDVKAWNVAKLRCDAAFMVEGRVDYVDRELAPRTSSAQVDGVALSVVPEREDAKVRSFLTANGDETSRRVTAPRGAELMLLYPGEVRTPWPNIQVTWSFGTSEHARQSLLQVTIPLRWRQHADQLHHASTASIIYGEIE